ncbi:MAG: cyclase family protein [Peptococcaceae bacterium]
MGKMKKIIDLTLPIRKHWRWPLESTLVHSFAKGDPNQVTQFTLKSHWYTHIDSPKHMLADGKTLEEYPLDILIGKALILDLSHIAASEGITPDILKNAARGKEMQQILILKTDWESKVSWESMDYWDHAPYITEEGGKWIFEQGPKVVGFDFPQDYDIRFIRTTPESQLKMPVHEQVLNKGVLMIEYLTNLKQIPTDTCKITALPLKLEEADGAPIRVVAEVE